MNSVPLEWHSISNIPFYQETNKNIQAKFQAMESSVAVDVYSMMLKRDNLRPNTLFADWLSIILIVDF